MIDIRSRRASDAPTAVRALDNAQSFSERRGAIHQTTEPGNFTRRPRIDGVPRLDSLGVQSESVAISQYPSSGFDGVADDELGHVGVAHSHSAINQVTLVRCRT